MNDAFDACARGLTDTEVLPNHGFPSYRVRGRIYATRPDDDHVHLMLDPDAIRDAAALAPTWCSEVWWGDKLSAVRIDLRGVDEAVWRALLSEAWARATLLTRRTRGPLAAP